VSVLQSSISRLVDKVEVWADELQAAMSVERYEFKTPRSGSQLHFVFTRS
jgi:hypothetical protein